MHANLILILVLKCSFEHFEHVILSIFKKDDSEYFKTQTKASIKISI